ncbi:phage tail length tape measure family protein [Mesorhizobium sp. WSM2561]|uniref:phage tail length tape measure family protein n=1 Tax=Mesorhizobium sp. WSM2561 TaxID=1040985 RepID=UPI0004AD2564|nr:phage tail length tape measure family protein [Mesorhizobium sp. WSM2561]
MDLATIGFKAETSDLVEAKAKLEALVPAATKVERASDVVNRSLTETGSAAQRAAAGIGKTTSAANAATVGHQRQAQAVQAATGANNANAASAAAAAGATTQLGNAADAAAGKIKRLQTAANQNSGAMKSNTGNIAAQFQDIGVTAAMGMNPLLIALQQGTQLSAVFAQSGASLGATLMGAFASVISPVSLLTIGIVALTAAAIQYFMTFIAGSEDNAEALEKEAALINKVTEQWGNAVPALKAYNDERKKLEGQKDLDTAVTLAIKGEYAELREIVKGLSVDAADLTDQLLTIGADPSKIVGMQDKFAQLFKEVNEGKLQVDTLKNVQDVLSQLYATTHIPAAQRMAEAIGGIADEFDRARKAGEALAADKALLDFFQRSPLGQLTPLTSGGGQFLNPDQLQTFNANEKMYEEAGASAAAAMIRGFESFSNKAYPDKKASTGEFDAWRVGFGSDTITHANGTFEKVTKDTVVTLADAQRDLSRRLIEFQTGIQKAIGIDTWNSLNEGQKAALSSIAYNYGQLPKSIVDAINGGDGPAAVAKAIAGLSANPERRRQEASAFLSGSGLSMSDAGLGASSTKKTPDDLFKGSMEQIQARIDLINAEAEAQRGLNPLITDYGYATEKARIEQQLLNDAHRAGVEVTPELADKIDLLAGNYAKASAGAKELEESQRKAAEAAREFGAFSKEILGGFISDLRNGLKSGEGFWDSFKNAAMNALDRIVDKLLNNVLDALFQVNSAGGGGGGILGSIFSLFGGGGGASAFTFAAGAGLWAKGGAFANGISGHSNSVVSSPTLFAFASGAGIMGEAGPEAIMPLQRGPDGSLGVQMHGKAASQAVNNNNVDVTNVYQISGAISREDIVAEIKNTAKNTLETTKKSMVSWLNQYSQDGSVVS